MSVSESGEHLHLLGQTVGKYRIASFLGEGGMAQVFVGEHVDAQIDRRVAIKVLRSEYCQSPQIVERFVNEARALGRINHPGVVEIFDVDRLASGRVCLVMELLRGEILFDYLAQRGGYLPATEAVAIAGQIAEAIAAAHDQRIIHRDLKPENVFLHRNPDGVRAKVLDFGIAKLLDGAGGVQTATRSQLGTATYMSPEQFRSSRDVDHRSDIYSLGCVLFQMLTGRPPFVARNLVEQMRAHAFEPAPPLAQFAPGAPAALGPVVARMLAKTREERFASMREVQAALQAAIGGTGVPMGGVMTTGQYVAAAGRGMPSVVDADPTVIDPPRAGASKKGLVIALIAIVVVAGACVALAMGL